MARDLLLRGMFAGLLAAVLATWFARGLGEPQVDLAIAFEAAHSAIAHAGAGAGAMPDVELVSRATQKGIGLLTAVCLYGAAVGGLFALVFTVAYGRVGRIGPRTLALALAAAAFVAIVLVPALKYPPTPPAVGRHETVGFRTMVYFTMIALSLASLVVSVRLGGRWAQRMGGFNAMLAAAAVYAALVFALFVMLPPVNEVPADFPAVVLWNFRIAAIVMQAVLWTAIGLGFGVMAERQLRRA